MFHCHTYVLDHTGNPYLTVWNSSLNPESLTAPSPGPLVLSAQPQPYHRRVVVTRPQALLQLPIVHMYVLHLDPALTDRFGNEDVVELLVVLVEHICVSLDELDFRQDVDLEHQAF